TGKYAWYGWGYGFDPRGGTNVNGGLDFDTSTSYGSYYTYIATKAWHLVDVSGSAFKTAGGASHEFKFGFGYNRRPSDSLTRYSGNSVLAINNGGGDTVAEVYRDRVVNTLSQTTDLFVGDT